MQKEKQGILTIFACLLLVSLLAFVGTVIEAVRITGARMQAQAVSDAAVDSVLSEYYRPLMDTYQLFFHCGAYAQPAFSEEEVTAHMQDYMKANLHPEDTSVFARNVNFWKLSMGETTLPSYVLATDDGGSAYRKQAADSVKYLIGDELIQKMKSWEENPLDFENLEQSFAERNADSEAQIAEAEEAEAARQADIALQEDAIAAGQEAGAEGEAGITVEAAQPDVTERTDYNPITIIKEVKEMGILELVLQNPQEASDKRIETDNCVSNRTLQTGSESTDAAASGFIETQTEKILFHEYLMRQFDSAGKSDKAGLQNGTALAYELEYLMEGKASDRENLKGVVHKLLLLRETVNFAYLLTDESKQLQAETLAVAITGVIGIAPLAVAVKYGILLAWAYGESIMDVRCLLAGGSVALTKSAATWQLSLENIGVLLEGTGQSVRQDANGFDYEGYLRLLLFAQNERTLTMRSLDLIEKNMRLQEGGACFTADALMEAMTARTVFSVQPLFFSMQALQPYDQMLTYEAVSSGSYLKQSQQ